MICIGNVIGRYRWSCSALFSLCTYRNLQHGGVLTVVHSWHCSKPSRCFVVSVFCLLHLTFYEQRVFLHYEGEERAVISSSFSFASYDIARHFFSGIAEPFFKCVLCLHRLAFCLLFCDSWLVFVWSAPVWFLVRLLAFETSHLRHWFSRLWFVLL